MNIQSLKIAYFSPTGSTRTVLKGIARGIGVTPELIDVTTPTARTSALSTGENDLLVLGVPVYMGRDSLAVPGSFPYGGITKLWDVDFIKVGESCTQCGVCAEHCPTGAIDRTDSVSFDPVKCITYCACIKLCPKGARDKKPGPVMDASLRIHSMYRLPKAPEFFL